MWSPITMIFLPKTRGTAISRGVALLASSIITTSKNMSERSFPPNMSEYDSIKSREPQMLHVAATRLTLLRYNLLNSVRECLSLASSSLFHELIADEYFGSLEIFLTILSIQILVALSSLFFASCAQLSITGKENRLPSGSSLSGFPMRTGLIPACPCNLSSALSTARLVCDVRRMRQSGFLRISCQIISAITVVLPVPGGPWISARSFARTDFVTASSCLSFRFPIL